MSEKLLNSPAAMCNIARRIALEAGEIILEYFEERDMGLQAKGDGSPVTLADQKAEEFIEEKLLEMLPNVPFIGEESVSAGHETDLSNVPYFWLVDPLDGTKEFIAGRLDFTVNIALIHDGEPLLGVVYAPAKGDLYAGYYDPKTNTGKAVRWLEENNHEKEIHVRAPLKQGLVILSSRAHGDNHAQDKFLERFKVAKIIRRGSSLKICEIAGGKADLYPRFGPTCEWDTAAGHAVLRAAGGYLRQLDGSKITYGQSADPKRFNPEFIASSFEWWEQEEGEASD